MAFIQVGNNAYRIAETSNGVIITAMIVVTGATGFVGGHLVARLVEAGESVRALARHRSDLPSADFVRADITDASSLTAAFEGAASVIHCVGVIRETGRQTFDRVHIHGTEHVIRACKSAGVSRIVYISALGARSDAKSRYHQSKWRAEEIVRSSSIDATTLRPSVIFGREGAFMAALTSLVTEFHVIPIIGDGLSLIQPIWVEDVVTCITGALTNDTTIGETYDLGGPATYGFEQLVDLIAASENVAKPKIHWPVSLVRPVAAVLGRLSQRFPLTSDQLTMLLEDNTCDIASMRRTFGIDPAPIREHLTD